MVTGRRDVGYFRITRVIQYVLKSHGHTVEIVPVCPLLADSSLMEQVQESLNAVFDKDPIAVLTGIYTGDGQRNWIFYTLSTHIFQKKINEALEEYPLLPLEISSHNDPGWEVIR